ncbi:MAG: hypothetical protein RLZZ253_397, partial [Verrucomicrobiota bacterium]
MLRARLHLVLLVLVLGLVLIRESREAAFQNAEALASGWLHKVPLRPAAKAPVTLVEIDPDSLRDHPWPWTPLDFALFFQAANQFQPAVLASNEVFSWKEPSAQDSALSKIPQYRKLLRDHLLRAKKVVLGGLLGFPEDPERLPPLQETPLIRSVKGDPKEVPEFTELLTQPDEDFRLSSAVGFLNPPPDRPLHSSIPLLWRYRGQMVPSLVLQSCILWEKATLDEVSVELGRFIRIGDRLRIPINSRGEMPVNPHAVFGRCSFEDLLLTTSQKENSALPAQPTLQNRSATQVPPELLSNRLLLLARTDPDSKNLKAPGLNPLSLGEWNALALATVLTESFPPPAPNWAPFLVLGIALLLGLLPRSVRWLHPCCVVPASLLIYGIAALFVFQSSQIQLPMLLPCGLGFLLLLSPWLAPAPVLAPPPAAPISERAPSPQTGTEVQPAVQASPVAEVHPHVSPAPTPEIPPRTPAIRPHLTAEPAPAFSPERERSDSKVPPCSEIPLPPLRHFPPRPVSLSSAAPSPAQTPIPRMPPPAFRPPP